MKAPFRRDESSVPFSKLNVRNAAARALALPVLLVFAFGAQAHPGHDPLIHGPAHLLASPFHLLTLVMLGLLFVIAAHVVRSTSARLILRAAATLCIVAAAAVVICR